MKCANITSFYKGFTHQQHDVLNHYLQSLTTIQEICHINWFYEFMVVEQCIFAWCGNQI